MLVEDDLPRKDAPCITKGLERTHTYPKKNEFKKLQVGSASFAEGSRTRRRKKRSLANYSISGPINALIFCLGVIGPKEHVMKVAQVKGLKKREKKKHEMIK